MPQRLQGNDFSMALAMGFANNKISFKYSSGISKKLSIYFFGITNVCPTAIGEISRKEKKFSFSAILKEGILPLIIAEKMVIVNFLKLTYRHTRNQAVMLSTLNLMIPAGTCISAVSPTVFPNNPLPMGDVADIFCNFRSASFSDTIW